MTDAELIELVQTRTPAELTEADIAALRERLPASAELRQALAEHLEMERYLTDHLAKVAISTDQVLARANLGGAAALARRRVRRWVALVLMLAVAVGGAAVWHFARTETEPNGNTPVVAVGPTPSQPGKTTEATKAGPTGRATPPATTKTPPEDPTPVTIEPPRNTASEPYALLDASEPALNDAQLKAWFAPVEGHPHALKPVPARPAEKVTAATEMTGLWRLRPAWKADAALRSLFRSFNSFKFHFWNGSEGVTLELWRSANRFPNLPDMNLVAYRTTRKGKGPLPDTLVLAAQDEGEFWRTRTQFIPPLNAYARQVQTPFDLRHEAGQLTASFGDVRILSVPHAEVPAEVYFEGEASFHSLGIAPLIPLPPLPAALPAVLDTDKLTELNWIGDPTYLDKQADGSVVLRAAKPEGRFTMATPLPQQGICETVVQLEGVMPGTGVFLGDDKGQPRHIASFMREEASGRIILLETINGENALSHRFVPPRWPPAFVNDKVWLRLLFACGTLKAWVSMDGITWARAFESPTGRPGEPCATIGLVCQGAEPRPSIRLRRLMVRELKTLNSLAPAELIRRAPLVTHNLYTPLGEWLAAVHATRPPDVDAVVWSRACALRTLASGVSPNQGAAMLETLLDHGMAQAMPFEDKVRLLDEAMLLLPKWPPQQCQRFIHYYERLGQALHREGETRPYSRLRQALYHTPVWAVHIHDVFPESLATEELLDLAGAGKWEEAEWVAQQGRIHRQGPSLFDWAESMATGRRPRVKPGIRRLALPSGWLPPVVLDPDKDGTNDLGEIDSALAANSQREAARILTRLKGRSERGLLPDGSDAQRMASWPVTLAGLLEAQPDLRALLRSEFAPEGKLQLRRALDEKDEVALEMLALRFHGTEEAAEALLWLGDRHLGDGEPALAVGRYRLALRMAEGSVRRRIEDRLHLTAAMMGQPGQAPASDIEFGTSRLTPAALQELRQKRREAGVDSRWNPPMPPQLAPAPDVFTLVSHGRFEGEIGDRPEQVPWMQAVRRSAEIDWFARHVALTVDGNRLFISNRFQVDCWEMPAGKLLWRLPVPRDMVKKEFPGASYEYPFTPMRPVVAGPHVFVRRLSRPLPNPYNPAATAVCTLACIEAASGKLVWSTTNQLQSRLHYVSDPLVVQDQVFVLAQKQAGEADRTLMLLVHNRTDGTLIAERPLAGLRATFDDQRGCQLTALEDGCLATVGGSVLAFDFAGNLRWARRSLWVPPEADTQYPGQPHEAPLVVGDRCWIVQPGVQNLVCLSPDNGRLRWQKAVFGLRRLAGLVENRLIVQTDGGFLCLDAATGKEQWHHVSGPTMSATLCGGPGGLVYATAELVPGDKELHQPILVWVDLETGREKTRSTLYGQLNYQPRFGPMFVAGDRVWAFSGKGGELKRDLLELVPKNEPPAATPAATEWDAWTRTVSAPLRSTAAKVLPGWTVFNAKPQPRIGLVPEYLGERDVLSAPLHFLAAKHLDVPNTDKPRLRIRATNEAKRQCTIAVDVEGKRVWHQDLNPGTTGDQWKDWEVDLSMFKGKRIWVQVRQIAGDGDNACTLWSKVELVE